MHLSKSNPFKSVTARQRHLTTMQWRHDDVIATDGASSIPRIWPSLIVVWRQVAFQCCDWRARALANTALQPPRARALVDKDRLYFQIGWRCLCEVLWKAAAVAAQQLPLPVVHIFKKEMSIITQPSWLMSALQQTTWIRQLSLQSQLLSSSIFNSCCCCGGAAAA